jgi:light-regulated signal transduction histidine kinase (bacteriophytochrome)
LDNARRFEAQIEAGHRAGHRVDDLNLANSELQQFIYVSSHDLQEPLRTITQYLDLLRRRHTSQLDDQARRYIAYASDSASRMYLLLNDLLTYSRLGHAAERTTVNLVDVVAEVVQDLRAVVAETHAKITLGDLPTVRCDRSMIRSLFQNLLGNAMKFRKDDAPHIMLSAQVDHAGLWTMSVADNGIGIRQEHRQAVFEVFHRLHDRDAFPGTGIGLAIARKVVEQHGGKIWIEETPHGGATFLFTLPEDGSGVRAAVEAA